MPRIRSIKHDLYLDEDLATLPFVCRYAFPGLWTLADREGRLEDRPARIKAQLFPYEAVDMDDILAQLAGRGFVVRYEVDGVRYLQVRSFAKHQQVNARETASRIPPPPGVPQATVPAPPDDHGSRRDTDVHVHARAVPCEPVHARGEGNGIQGRGTDHPPTPLTGGVVGGRPDTPAVPPRLVPRPPGTRSHPLDEDQAPAYADPLRQERAALWLERFAEAHATVRQSRYVPKPQRDFEPALRLVQAYTDRELAALTALYLEATGEAFEGKPRTPGHLAHVASMLEERLKEVGQWPSAA